MHFPVKFFILCTCESIWYFVKKTSSRNKRKATKRNYGGREDDEIGSEGKYEEVVGGKHDSNMPI